MLMKKNLIQKYIYCLALVLLVLYSCTITPDLEDQIELSPIRNAINTPKNVAVANNHSKTNPSMTVTWDPVEGATYYIVEYESATDYLSGKDMRSFIVSGKNQFTLENVFSNPSDMRYVFQVKAGMNSSNGQKIISVASDLKEGAIVNDFTTSTVLSKNVLKIYSSIPKIKSVVSGNIVKYDIKYYDGDFSSEGTELSGASFEDGNEIPLQSAEEKIITAVLFVDGEEVLRKKIDVKNDPDYIPPALVSLSASKNELNQITLSWEAKEINKGLPESTTLKFKILKKKADSNYEVVKDKDGNDLLLDGNTYTDTSISPNTDYTYMVVSYYCMTIDEKEVMYEESIDNRKTDTGWAIYSKPKTFTAKGDSGFDSKQEGDAKYTISLKWEPYHPVSGNISYTITRNEYNSSSTGTVVYTGSDTNYIDNVALSAEENKKKHQYIYIMQIVVDEKAFDETTLATDESGKDAIIETIPTVTQFDFINDVKVTSGENAHADKVAISWSWNDEGFSANNLDKSKASLKISRREDGMTTFEELATVSGSDSSYDDTSAKKGISYSYVIQPVYNDESSNYNGQQPSLSPVVGNTLSEAKNITATKNSFDKTISISWDPVEYAKGYIVYYKEQGQDDSQYKKVVVNEGTSIALAQDKNNLTPGLVYDITVAVVDSYSGEAKSSEIVQGSIFGSIVPTVTGGKNALADTIKVSWEPVENAKKYIVEVYSDESSGNSIIYQECNDTTFTFSSDDVMATYQEGSYEYPLSRPYYVTVVPVVGSKKPEGEATRVKGNWIMPPKNITATKAISDDSVKVNWDKTSDADGYYLYYSETPNNFDDDHKIYINENTDTYMHRRPDRPYYYALSSVINKQEGPVQNCSDNVSNYGYPLLPPTNVSSNDLGEGKLEYSFEQSLGATGYYLQIEGNEYKIDLKNPNKPKVIDSSNSTEYTGLSVSISQYGRITCELRERPSVTKAAAIISSVSSINENENATIDHNKSRTVDCSVELNSLYDYEYVNLLIYAMAPLYAEADAKWESDWWEGNDTEEFYTRDNTVYFTRPSGLGAWETAPWTDGYTKFTNYTFIDSVGNQYNVESGQVKNRTIDIYWDPLHPLATTPLRRLISYPDAPIIVNFPSYLGGKKTIVFNDYYIDGSKGEITVDGKAIDITKITNRVL